jgi:hypothetical protein
MKNPYHEEAAVDEIRPGRAGLIAALVAFLFVLLIPSYSLLSRIPEMKIREESVKSLPLFESWRKEDSLLLRRAGYTGNQRVFSGRDGWLYYRSDLDAVYGKGPYHTEPPSVAREKRENPWQAPVPLIKEFSHLLSDRGMKLILVPVPTKPMICREGLWLPRFSGTGSHWEEWREDLASSGVEVVDLFPLFGAVSSDEECFLKQDTHWTPQMMEAAAKEVAFRCGPLPPESDSLDVQEVERESYGDLVGMLDLGAEPDGFTSETVSLRQIAESNPGNGESQVVVLGDSFVNIYEDPGLGFGKERETSLRAGFSSHLSNFSGENVHTIAINGGGATAVREAFVNLPEEQLHATKVVVWVLSSRDILLPEIPAGRAGIEWRPVAFPESGPEKGSVKGKETDVVATLQEVSLIEDPAQTPYASAIYSALFVEDGENAAEHFVFLWAFRDRKLEATSSLETGKRYRLRLVPLSDSPDASRATRIDDLFRVDLSPSFAVGVEAE